MTDFGYGQMTPWDTADESNIFNFAMRQILSRISTMKLVQVKAVHSGAEFGAPGTVDVLPLVNQIDGNNNATPHGTVNGIAFARAMGGHGAIISDPKVGDIGFVVVSDRDISNVKSSGKQSNPGSHRRFDLSDGVYVGGVLGPAPEQYIAFGDGKITIKDKNSNTILIDTAGVSITDKSGNVVKTTSSGISLDASGKKIEVSSSGIALTGNVTVTGNISATGTIIADDTIEGAGIGLSTHIHGGVQNGLGETTPGIG